MTLLSKDDFFCIFSWLPAKSICKFNSACKSFLEFSDDAYFVMKHAQNIMLKDDTCFLLQPNIPQSYNCGIIEIHPLPGEELYSGVPKSFMQFLKSARIISSSNGLVLSREGLLEMYIYNPITQERIPIATPTSIQERPHLDINVLFKCTNDDYKIFLFEKPPEWSSYLNLKVYSAKEGVWKDMDKVFLVGPRNMRLENPLYLHGALHVISDSFPSVMRESVYFRPYIMRYNIESGESTMLRLPKDARRRSHDFSCNMDIFEWGKVKSSDHSICLVRHLKNVFTIWVLVDYKSNIWSRILETRVKAMGLKEEDLEVKGFRIMNGDCLNFSTENKVYRYDLIGQNSGKLKEICENQWGSEVCFTPYSNTLRPCDIGASTSSCCTSAHLAT